LKLSGGISDRIGLGTVPVKFSKEKKGSGMGGGRKWEDAEVVKNRLANDLFLQSDFIYL